MVWKDSLRHHIHQRHNHRRTQPTDSVSGWNQTGPGAREMAKDRDRSKKVDNGVVPSKADLQATGSWSMPLFTFALILTILLVGTMFGSDNASAFFGQ